MDLKAHRNPKRKIKVQTLLETQRHTGGQTVKHQESHTIHYHSPKTHGNGYNLDRLDKIKHKKMSYCSFHLAPGHTAAVRGILQELCEKKAFEKIN